MWWVWGEQRGARLLLAAPSEEIVSSLKFLSTLYVSLSEQSGRHFAPRHAPRLWQPSCQQPVIKGPGVNPDQFGGLRSSEVCSGLAHRLKTPFGGMELMTKRGGQRGSARVQQCWVRFLKKTPNGSPGASLLYIPLNVEIYNLEGWFFFLSAVGNLNRHNRILSAWIPKLHPDAAESTGAALNSSLRSPLR